MKYLLDTHIWLWWTTGSSQITKPLKRLLNDKKNEIYFSVASAWEIAIKYRTGKLLLPESPLHYIRCELAKQHIMEIPISADHVVLVAALPMHHQDPFDRLLIAQCILEGTVLITADRLLEPYEIGMLRIR